MGAKRNAYRALVRKPKGKRPLGRPTHKWKFDTKIDLRERRYGVVWTELI
jgi:hypothetical protein